MNAVRISVAGAGLIGTRHIEEVDAGPRTQVASIVDAETVRHLRLPLLDERVAELIGALDRQIHGYSSNQD